MDPEDIFYSFINIILPSRCQVCGAVRTVERDILCHDCYMHIIHSFSYLISSTKNIDRVYSSGFYENYLKDAMILFKYRCKRDLVYVFTVLLYYLLKESGLHINKPDMIIPVPLHKKKKLKRTFNQSSDIAVSISLLLDIKVTSDVLLKKKNTPPQKGLTRKQRKENLKNAFEVTDMSLVKNKHILLVDDVITTGATLDSCAKELLNNGAEKISGITLAKRM